MQIQNIFYFLIFSYYCLKYLMSPGIQMRSPFDREQRILFDGPEACWIIIFSTGILAFQTAWIVDIMALRLFMIEILCIVGMFIVKRQPVWTIPLLLYVAYLVWILAGCTYSPAPSFGIRVFLKYLFPLLMTLFASAAVRHTEIYLKAGSGAVVLGVICIVLFYIVPFAGSLLPGVFWYGTARAIHFISLFVFCLTLFYYTNEKRKYLILAILFMLPCFLWVFRTSIMGTIVALATFYFIKYKERSLPIILAIFIAGVVAVFTIPSLHDKMFKKETKVTLEQFEEGEVSMKHVETNAREAMWEYLDKKFYEKHKAIGCGTGTVQEHMYTHDLFGGIKVPHSDFVQMRCDNGNIGLGLYVLMILAIFIHCFRTYWSYGSIPIKMCALTAGSSLLGVFVTLYSENTVNYSMATLSMPFGFYGMMLGLIKGEQEKNEFVKR